ncbi:MAG: helix-turn-helix transcriptional regulator [Deltaproteobacteria bacterium]|nr:helix-turn-helix transcriptional regulator [Nannocystaceae bacterium]
MSIATPSGADWPRLFEGLLGCCHAAELRAPSSAELARLRRARTFIASACVDTIDLVRMAQSAQLSRFHFLRRFRAVFGETPHEYLTRCRIERAKTLLLESDAPVTEICFEVGYGSVGSFSSLFARHVGRSPEHFRRRWLPSAAVTRPVPGCFLAMFGTSNIREATRGAVR